jgi:CHAT domain-containing protein
MPSVFAELASVFLVAATAVPVRLEHGALQPGVLVEGRILPAEVHVHRVAVDAGDYVLVRLEQRGLDLVLAAKTPDGQPVDEFHDPEIVDRPERWSFVAGSAGEYVLEVTAAPGKEGPPEYAVALEERRPPVEPDRARMAAERGYLEAQKLRLRGHADDRAATLARYEDALRVFETQGDLTMQGRCLFGLRGVSWGLGTPARTLEYAQRLYAVRRQEGDQRGQGRALLAVGGAYDNLHQKAKALQHYEAALAALTPLEDAEGVAYALYNIGAVYGDTGEPDQALDYLQRALPMFRERRHPWESSVLLAMGIVYERTARHEEALRIDEQALALARRIGDREGEALLLNNIGVIEELMGDPRRAIGYFERSLEILKEVGAPQTDAIVVSNIGRSWHELGDQDRALQFLTRSLAMSRAASDPAGEGITTQKIGEVREAKGELREALAQYRRAVELFHQSVDRMREADALRDVGDVLLLLGQPQEALATYEEALPASRKVADRKGESATLHSQARAYLAQGRLPEAQAASEEALKMVESLRAGVLAQERRTSFLAAKRDYYDLQVDILMRRHQQEPAAGYAAAALEASERGRGRGLLETLAEARVDLRAGVATELVDREQALRRQVDAKADRLTRLLGSAGSAEADVKAARQDIDRLLAEYEDARSAVRAASPRYASLTQPQPLDLARIQREVLDDDTLLLEYALGQEKSYVWAVTRDTMVSAALPARARIEAAARRLHELMGSGYRAERTVQARLEAAALSRMILGPVAAQLGRKRLLVVAEGALQYVPFAALPAPGSGAGRPLVARHEIVQAPSASALAVLRRDVAGRAPAARAVAVLADPVLETSDPRVRRTAREGRGEDAAAGDGRASQDLARSADETGVTRLRRLRFTRSEADRIVALAGGAPALKAVDFEASRATVQRADLADYRIVHFATHGLLNNQHPALSGLVLSLVTPDGQPQDGFLRLHDVFNLKLGADLVVLSACRTALGADVRGEGLVGLTRGFWYAGAPRVMASLWDVRDQATAELMRRFYRRLLRDGLRPAAALRQAQLAMMKEERWASPYYWAGFVLQGEWN